MVLKHPEVFFLGSIRLPKKHFSLCTEVIGLLSTLCLLWVIIRSLCCHDPALICVSCESLTGLANNLLLQHLALHYETPSDPEAGNVLAYLTAYSILSA